MSQRPTSPPSATRRLTGWRGLFGALRDFGLLGSGLGGGELDAFQATDGQSIPVHVLGDGAPVVLVHGLGCSHQQWLPVARRLARRRCVLAWDARGHGRCRPAPDPITLPRLASDLAELMDHFGLMRPVLVGHSMGAMAVMQYLQAHGTRRVSAVVLVDQSPRIVTDDAWRLGLFGGCSAAMLHGLVAGARQDLARTVLNEIGAFGGDWLQRRLAEDAWVGRLLRRRLQRVDVRPLLALVESLAAADFRPTLPRLDVPLRVVLGGRSPHYGGLPLGDWYRQAVPHAEVATYASAGHSPHVSEPLRFARELESFLDDHR